MKPGYLVRAPWDVLLACDPLDMTKKHAWFERGKIAIVVSVIVAHERKVVLLLIGRTLGYIHQSEFEVKVVQR